MREESFKISVTQLQSPKHRQAVYLLKDIFIFCAVDIIQLIIMTNVRDNIKFENPFPNQKLNFIRTKRSSIKSFLYFTSATPKPNT